MSIGPRAWSLGPLPSPVCGIPCRGQETTPASHGILQVAMTAVGIFSDLTLCLI